MRFGPRTSVELTRMDMAAAVMPADAGARDRRVAESVGLLVAGAAAYGVIAGETLIVKEEAAERRARVCGWIVEWPRVFRSRWATPRDRSRPPRPEAAKALPKRARPRARKRRVSSIVWGHIRHVAGLLRQKRVKVETEFRRSDSPSSRNRGITANSGTGRIEVEDRRPAEEGEIRLRQGFGVTRPNGPAGTICNS